jgi:hypothetical protein
LVTRNSDLSSGCSSGAESRSRSRPSFGIGPRKDQLVDAFFTLRIRLSEGHGPAATSEACGGPGREVPA